MKTKKVKCLCCKQEFEARVEPEIRKENPPVISELSLEVKQAIYESRAKKVIDDLNQKIWR